eukprot:358593-Chlamydomonas_euryale.AAC.3
MHLAQTLAATTLSSVSRRQLLGGEPPQAWEMVRWPTTTTSATMYVQQCMCTSHTETCNNVCALRIARRPDASSAQPGPRAIPG